MIKKTKSASYQVSEMKDANRYWFQRVFCDRRHGRDRDVLAVVEKSGWEGRDASDSLPWNVSIEDRSMSQTWKLVLMKINGEDKIIFERFSRTNEGIKEEMFSLPYLPTWIIEEIKELAMTMVDRKMDSDGQNFLTNLVTKIDQETLVAKAGLSAKVYELSIGGLYHILSETRTDARGSFREVVRFPEIELLTGYDFVGKQASHSVSSYGVLRGMHVEPWAKLVTVISGLAISVFLDCRPHSRTFGQMEKVLLGYGTAPDGTVVNGGAVFIEPGIANSLLVLSEKMDYNYVVDDLWRPDTALYAVNPMDPKLAIDWGKYVPVEEIVRSERDVNAPSFAEFTKKMKDR